VRVPAHSAPNITQNSIFRGVAPDDAIDARHGVDGNGRGAEQRGHTAVVVRVTVRHDDTRERLGEPVRLRTKRSCVGHAQGGVNRHDGRGGFDEIRVDREQRGLEPVNGYT
jgi:hypothetical protein